MLITGFQLWINDVSYDFSNSMLARNLMLSNETQANYMFMGDEALVIQSVLCRSKKMQLVPPYL